MESCLVNSINKVLLLLNIPAFLTLSLLAKYVIYCSLFLLQIGAVLLCNIDTVLRAEVLAGTLKVGRIIGITMLTILYFMVMLISSRFRRL